MYVCMYVCMYEGISAIRRKHYGSAVPENKGGRIRTAFFFLSGRCVSHTYIHTYIYTFKHTYNFYHNNALYNTIAKDLISRILVPNPQDRARIPDLKKHEWYAHPNLATHFFSITIVRMYVCMYVCMYV